MAKAKEGVPVVKNMDDVDFSSGQPAEIELDQPTDDLEVTYEGGPLDGQRGEEAAEDQDLAKKIEKRLEADKAKETPKTEKKETPAADGLPTGKDEEHLPEIEVAETTGKEKSEAAGAGTQAGVAESTAAAGEGESAYTPNLTYKAFGQEKQFPDWAKPLVTSQESETQMRDLFSKADGLEEMKPKYHEATSQRDEARALVQEHATKVQRLIDLRQKNPAQFFEEMGVSESQVLRHARDIITAREDENTSRAYDMRRDSERQLYAQELAATRPNPQATAFATMHQELMSTTLASPEVAGYKANFERLHGAGSFDREVARYGTHVYNSQQGRYVPPAEAVKAVIGYYGEGFKSAPQQPAPAAPAAPGGGASPAPARAAAPARPKVMPRVGGNGSNASPTKQRLKSLDEVKAKVAAELD